MSEAIILDSVRALLHEVNAPERHPGLALDKFSPTGKQESQKDALAVVCCATGDAELLARLATRREAALRDAGAQVWQAETAGPLTLHLSRANAFENAGIALHPLYGFAYLPGSGLKGAARAFAETIWLPLQNDDSEANRRIAKIFGSAPSNENAAGGSAGAVVFHDAWPQTWPRLFVDIAAVHHPDYYQASDTKVPPPGDWEEPKPISFLAIPAGTHFRFALAPRMVGQSSDPETLALARVWLTGALSMLGVGAKTAAGYGRFKTDAPAPTLPASRAEALFNLALLTPAFLAGATQDANDCDLRGATLRGQLRWWWRTMHAAHLEPRMLRRLETAIWGASSEGSAVQIDVTASRSSNPETYDFKKDRRFFDNNELQKQRGRQIPGFLYLSYGMDDEPADKPGSKRCYRQPGDGWTVRLVARASVFRTDAKVKPKDGAAIGAKEILAQAEASLWLLCRFGGVGAKGRKGFGSLGDVSTSVADELQLIRKNAAALRLHCRIPLRPEDPAPKTATLERLKVEEITLNCTNPWFAIDFLGRAYQEAVKSVDPRLKSAKELLGMPRTGIRSVHSRLASTVHLHVAGSPNGLAARVATFDLPGINPSATQFLSALRAGMKKGLSASNVRRGAGSRPIHPPRKGAVVHRTIEQVAAPAKAAQPLAADRNVLHPGQTGYDSAGQSVRIIKVDGTRLFVLFVDEDEEDWIDAVDFRPASRR